MLSSIIGLVSRRARTTAAAAALAAAAFAASPAQAQDEVDVGSAYSLSFGTEFTSHFISYGADVWGGGDEWAPFGDEGTVFTYGTLSAAITEDLTGFVNVWGDINNNVDSGLGGQIQEIDVNVGLTYAIPDTGLSVTAANGIWAYGGSSEKIFDVIVAYADTDERALIEGFSLSPSVTFHYRYDGVGGQETGLAIVGGIKPTITFMEDSTYPLSVAFPVSVAWFEDGFQGGDSGLGFVSAGVSVSVPLAFIPPEFGLWSAFASATYWYTPDDTVPNNPEESFVVTSVGVGLAF